MINSENITNRPAFQYKNVTGKLTTEFYGKVSTKLVRAGSLLQGTLAIRKANLVEKKKIREGQKRDRFEDRLEANPNVEKNKNFINRIPRPGSGVSVLGWFKNFIGSVALGFFATKLLGSLPLFQGILKGVLGVADFVASTGVFLVNAITTFIDIGYKAYDSTAGFLKAIGGDDAIGIFDTFTDRLSSLIDVIIVASIVRGGGLGLGIGGPGAGLRIGSSAERAARKQEEIRAAKDTLDAAKPSKKPVTKAPRRGGSAPAAAAGERARQRKEEEEKRRKTEERDKAIQKRLDEREQQRLKQRKLLRGTTAFRQRQKSIKGITIENRKKLARAARVRRQNQLLSTDAGRRSFELDRFLGQGGITTDPEYKLFKRINALDRVIEKNQVEGNSAAARRNIKERDILFKKLQKGQTLRQRGGRVTPVEGIGKVKRLIRRRADTAFLTGLEPDPKLMGKAFTDAQADFDADQKAGIRGGRVARDISGMSRLDRAVSRVPIGVTARGLRRIPDRLILKLFGKKVRRLAGRLPIIGGLVDFGISILEGDPIPKAAMRATFAGLGGGIGAFLGALTGPFAPILAPIGALLVGGLADALGSYLYDAFLKGFFPSSSKGGNVVTRTFQSLIGPVWKGINELIFGEKDLFADLQPVGGFVEDRPGHPRYKKSTQPQVAPRPGSKGIPLPPREPVIPPRKPPMGGKVNFGSLLDLVTSGEGGLNSVNRGNAGDTPGGARSILGKDLTDMTLDEIFAAQNAGKVFAVGKYQIIPKTMKGFRDYLRSQGIDTSKRKFDASLQNMFGPYSITQKRAKVGRFLSGDTSVSLDTAQLELAAEYASIGVPYDMKKGSYNGKYPLRDIKKGESLYSGTGSNYAPAAHTDQIRSMLQKLREQASYEKSDSTVVVNSSTIANNITPVPIPTNNDVPVIASSGGDSYDPFQSTYKIG